MGALRSFASATTGWAVGTRGTVTKTVDGGVRWTLASTGISNTSTLYGVHVRTLTFKLLYPCATDHPTRKCSSPPHLSHLVHRAASLS
eukprot:9504063-Pyramimonas_sp.AAC.2